MQPSDSPRVQTRRHQTAAADPTASAWVSANAGTGKTHVLTLRMLRLLLNGTEPARILALTYTKAAAAEMATRVFARLAEWVTAPDGTLEAALVDLLGRRPSAEEMRRARQLFALVIETPGGLKVQTIHAFCERLLQRFPLEAGVPPGFEILDDETRQGLLEDATNEVLTESAETPGSLLAKALETAVSFANEGTFEALLADALRQRDWLEAAVRLDVETDGERLAEAEDIYRRALDLAPGATLEAVREQLAGVLSDAQLQRLHRILGEGSTSDVKTARILASVLAAVGPDDRIAALRKVFIKSDGEPRTSFMTKRLAAQHGDAVATLESAQRRFLPLNEDCGRLQLMQATLALVRLGNAVMQRYTQAKTRHAQLDFDDLIVRTSSLLRQASAQWVLYKLDGGLDHILVDEAQDTSPLQWDVITALAEELFAGQSAREEPRTLFAVGDEKQSIYSFQGAEPKMFAEQGKRLGARAAATGQPWRQVPLTLSFRSVEPVLSAVDAVFARSLPGLGSAEVRHVADRAGHAGLVEIWPTEKHESADPAEPWSPLLEKADATPSVVRLANRIADTIAGWLTSGEMIESENRPVRAGDILVLVRKREPFAPELVRALKTRGVPVAGADRLNLTEQIAVQDLMALGDVLTLPDDDLSLAAVLKSPLFDLDDDDLLALAHGRSRPLWAQLQHHAGAGGRFAEAAQTLARWRREAEDRPPFEFYAGVLDRDGGRARMLARLGSEAADAIDELLNLALAHDETAPPALQGFLSRLRQGERQIKRDMEQGRDEVRVMTVHGAKGLEAPIVFLPDTCSTRSARQANALLILEEAERQSALPAPFLWPVKGTSKVEAVRAAKQRVAAAETEERNRLLYVALTRARDRLYVAGFEGARAPGPDCWYNLVKDGLDATGRLRETTAPDGRTVWRLQSSQAVQPAPGKVHAPAAPDAVSLPAWARTAAVPEPVLAQPLAPSRLAPLEAAGADKSAAPRRLAAPAVVAPARLVDDSRFLRGNLTHALLEHLPQVPQRGWAAAAETFLTRHGDRLSPEVRRGIARETLAILQHHELAPLFGPGSRAEVPIAAELPRPDGKGPALRLTGKIDRLVATEEEVLILDYKTNRPSPPDEHAVPDAYLFQLAAYRLGISRIFPGKPVRAAILWTDAPRFMRLPEARLDEFQTKLWEQAPTAALP
ncbi:MAG TPA: double-strand break repair helicase AddA [Hyphomicrobiaceae bacterium]|nr:double-strand break repair helicase AddA [Hyphomicrobiaceae bacterium]